MPPLREQRPALELGDQHGADGNPFVVMGKVIGALKRAGMPEQASEFRRVAMTGSYELLMEQADSYVVVSRADGEE